MSIEIKIKDRIAKVEIVSQLDNLLEIKVDDKIYKIDLMHTADGSFSIIENGHSYDIELVPGEHHKEYKAYTLYNIFDVEIIDAESRYIKNRNNGSLKSKETTISTPMPGKVVKINVKEGDPITKGEAAIIISSMKMESEYKSPKNGTVKKIFVQEGDAVESNQILIEIE